MNTVKMNDQHGGTDYMVRINKATLHELKCADSDALHDAFFVNGQEVEELYIGKYAAAIYNDRAYSLPYQKATTEITFKDAADACAAKGPGWHMATNAEMALLALICQRLGSIPHGNTNNGKYHGDETERGLTYDDCDILTGSGPVTWSHDHTEDGVYDLCGNIFEMCAGLKLVNGIIHVIPNNDAAINSDDGWVSLGVGFVSREGKLVLVPADLVKRDFISGWFHEITVDPAVDAEVVSRLKAIGMVPVSDKNVGHVWLNNEGEWPLSVGGHWHNGVHAGARAVSCDAWPWLVSTSVGVRLAFVKLKSA
ncbi:MAG: hypothetical protein FWB91_00270 [Defluviitaleaceae bacterium]|nr:hypothetical protein [Defluviitaleaceae bacterium]